MGYWLKLFHSLFPQGIGIVVSSEWIIWPQVGGYIEEALQQESFARHKLEVLA